MEQFEPILQYHKLYADVETPEFATAGSACFDVPAYFGTKERMFLVYNHENIKQQYLAFQPGANEPYQTVLNPGDRALIPTGLIFNIPNGYSVRAHIRSGLALKHGLTMPHGEAVIDSDYVGQYYIALLNRSTRKVTITHGDRIAQLEMVPVLKYQMQLGAKPEMKTTRDGGFGSTGR